MALLLQKHHLYTTVNYSFEHMHCDPLPAALATVLWRRQKFSFGGYSPEASLSVRSRGVASAVICATKLCRSWSSSRTFCWRILTAEMIRIWKFRTIHSLILDLPSSCVAPPLLVAWTVSVPWDHPTIFLDDILVLTSPHFSCSTASFSRLARCESRKSRTAWCMIEVHECATTDSIKWSCYFVDSLRDWCTEYPLTFFIDIWQKCLSWAVVYWEHVFQNWAGDANVVIVFLDCKLPQNHVIKQRHKNRHRKPKSRM